MHDRYWGFEQSPLARELEPRQLEASPIHREALARLDFLRESKLTFGILIGPSGCGKSAVLAEFARKAARLGCVAISVQAAAADEQAVLSQLAAGFDIPDQAGWHCWRQLMDCVAELRLEQRSAVVLLDDLDRAANSGLGIVERLLSLAGAPLTLVASARPQSAGRLGINLLEHAALRIDLSPWSEAETADFLAQSLSPPSRHEPIFDAAATRQIFELSGGAPRRVRQLAQLALVAGASQQLTQIDEQTILAVRDELTVVQ